MTAPRRRPRAARAAAHRAERPGPTGAGAARSAPLGAHRAPQRPGRRPADNPANTNANRPADTSADRPADTSADRSADTSADRPADTSADRPADRAADNPATNPAATTTDHPTDHPAPPATTAVRVGAIVPAGGSVGLDDSAAVGEIATEVVAAGPALAGTSSFETLAALTATDRARTGATTVRLFGGVHHAGAFTGPTSLQAVTATRCDVALVAGCLVGDEVWVPTAGYVIRRGLLLAAQRTYLVAEDPAAARPGAWTRLGDLAEFAGAVEPLAPPGGTLDHAVA